MRLIIVGCEYSGKTTLVNEIIKWRNDLMGPPTPKGIVEYHDHFTLPWVGHWDEISEKDLATFMSLGPELKEMFQRYQFSYHLENQLYNDSDHILIGFHIEEAVYAPRYYGYGGEKEYGDRKGLARHIDSEISHKAPDTVLILLKTTPEVIKKRMKTTPHTRTVLKEEDIQSVLDEFDEEFRNSFIRNKLTIDTSESTINESLQEFITNIGPFLSDKDRLRIQANQILKNLTN